jgi:hypothetical protein
MTELGQKRPDLGREANERPAFAPVAFDGALRQGEPAFGKRRRARAGV